MTSGTPTVSVSVVPSWGFFEFHFAKERLKHYMDACDGDPEYALALYQWNTEISAAFWESLGYLEIAFRNVVDRQLVQRNTKKNRTNSWIYDENFEFGRKQTGEKHNYPYSDVITATKRIEGHHKSVTPGQIISELSFGFWHNMVSKSRMQLWPEIAGGFKFAPDRNQLSVSEPVERLRAFRNRIGHHHRIWSEDTAGRYADVLLVAGYIDPRLSSWIDSHSRVPTLLAISPTSSPAGTWAGR